jgi:hypothetical protein
MALVDGVAYWASITTPNVKFKPVYTINLVVDQEVAKDFKMRGFKVKQMDEGPALIIRRNANTASGKDNPAPKLVDENRNPVDVTVGNGSKVRVQYREWETSNSYGDFKGLDLQAVQILKLAQQGIPDGHEFCTEETLEDEL